jgi:hypothetical protein
MCSVWSFFSHLRQSGGVQKQGGEVFGGGAVSKPLRICFGSIFPKGSLFIDGTLSIARVSRSLNQSEIISKKPHPRFIESSDKCKESSPSTATAHGRG